jgi:plasmid stabilization system protein ParE
MKIFFLEPAEQELDSAIEFYEEELACLGKKFQAEVIRSVTRIKEYPNSYQQLSLRTRRCLVAKFPYGLIYSYQESKSEIIIVAVANLHRRPDYWTER